MLDQARFSDAFGDCHGRLLGARWESGLCQCIGSHIASHPLGQGGQLFGFWDRKNRNAPIVLMGVKSLRVALLSCLSRQSFNIGNQEGVSFRVVCQSAGKPAHGDQSLEFALAWGLRFELNYSDRILSPVGNVEHVGLFAEDQGVWSRSEELRRIGLCPDLLLNAQGVQVNHTQEVACGVGANGVLAVRRYGQPRGVQADENFVDLGRIQIDDRNGAFVGDEPDRIDAYDGPLTGRTDKVVLAWAASSPIADDRTISNELDIIGGHADIETSQDQS